MTPAIIVPTYEKNWPMKPASHSSFEKALAGEVGDAVEDSTTDLLDEAVPPVDDPSVKAGLGDEEEETGDGWDMGDDIALDAAGADSDFVKVDNPDDAVAGGSGSSEVEIWSRNSPLAADHVAAGSLESAMQLLNRQVGAVNFAPLKPRFMEIYTASKTFLSASPGLPPLVNYVRRTLEETEARKVLPMIPRDLETIAANDLQEGYTAMRTNRLADGVTIFKAILHSLLVNIVSSQSRVEEAKSIISKAVEYTLAMSVELARREMASASDAEQTLKRQLELNAYFTVPKLEVAHRQLALTAAMKQAFAKKQFSSSLSFANRIIANGTLAKLVENVSISNPLILRPNN